jgi:hypothetical protein
MSNQASQPPSERDERAMARSQALTPQDEISLLSAMATATDGPQEPPSGLDMQRMIDTSIQRFFTGHLNTIVDSLRQEIRNSSNSQMTPLPESRQFQSSSSSSSTSHGLGNDNARYDSDNIRQPYYQPPEEMVAPGSGPNASRYSTILGSIASPTLQLVHPRAYRQTPDEIVKTVIFIQEHASKD